MMKTNSVNKIESLGTISDHQWGIVLGGGGIASAIMAVSYKYPLIVVRKWSVSESDKQLKKDI